MPQPLNVTPRPAASERPVRTLYLDFEGEEAPQATPEAFEVRPAEGAPRFPDEVTTESGVIHASFADPLERGTYQVVVRPSHMSLGGEPVDLMEGPGDPFGGWELRVLAPARGAEPEPDLRTAAEGPAELKVFVGGREAAPGAVGLEGETVILEGPGDYSLRVEGLGGALWDADPGPFAEHLTRVEKKEKAVFHAAARFRGPVPFSWALYEKGPLAGRLPSENGELVLYHPVSRYPRPIEEDPLFDLKFSEAPAGDHPNTYRRATLLRRPVGHEESRRAGGFVPARSEVWATQVQDRTWTPETDPHLFPEDRYVKTGAPAAEDTAAALAIPLNARVEVLEGGRVCWQGLTRLFPQVASLRMARSEGLSGSDMDLSVALWKASQIALQKWKGPIPKNPPPTMREFALCRAKLGAAREEGFQGKVTSSEGDVTVSGQSAHQLRSRLKQLTELLEAGEEELPLFPEDEMHVRHAASSRRGSSFSKSARRRRGKTSSFWKRRHSRIS